MAVQAQTPTPTPQRAPGRPATANGNTDHRVIKRRRRRTPAQMAAAASTTTATRTPSVPRTTPPIAAKGPAAQMSEFIRFKADFITRLLAAGIALTEQQCGAWVTSFKADLDGAYQTLAKAA